MSFDERIRASKRRVPPRVDRKKPIPASFGQARLWFLDRLEPGSSTYNVSVALRLEGALDIDALERAVQELVRRHETLRTTYVVIDGQPHQEVLPSWDYTGALNDMRFLAELGWRIANAPEMPRYLPNEQFARPRLNSTQ